MRAPYPFFVLAFALSAPWWIAGLFLQVDGMPDRLPVTDIGAVMMPPLAAAILVWREEGWRGVRRALLRLLDVRRITADGWIAIVAMPAVLFSLTYVLQKAIDPVMPEAWLSLVQVAPLFAFFLVGAAAEEFAYTGYATERTLARLSPLSTALVIGVPWAVWHLPSMIMLGQSMGLLSTGLAVTVAFRVLYVGLFVRSGRSVAAVVLVHALFNTGRSAFPGGRAVYEAHDAVVGYGLIVLLAAVLVVVGGRSLGSGWPKPLAGPQP